MLQVAEITFVVHSFDFFFCIYHVVKVDVLFKAEIDIISILEEVQESHHVSKSAGLEHQDFISKVINLHLAEIVL